jgi:DNA-directed RNA polymerase specialized sigma24 family protein
MAGRPSRRTLTPEQWQLVTDSIFVIPWAAKKICPHVLAMDPDLVHDIGMDRLMYAASTWNPARGKWSTWVGYVVKMGLLRPHKNWGEKRKAITAHLRSLDYMPADDVIAIEDPWAVQPDEAMQYDEMCEAVTHQVSRLAAGERTAVGDRYLRGAAGENTGRRYGITHQAVSNRIAKGMKILRSRKNMLEKVI